jgi:predicted transcriptional regulator
VEEPVVRASLNRTVTVGVDLRRRLEALARPQGADASYLARTILRRYLETHERPADAAGRAE